MEENLPGGCKVCHSKYHFDVFRKTKTVQYFLVYFVLGFY